MSTHTKGPWTIATEDNASCDINCGDTIINTSRYAQNGDGFCIDRDEMRANAKLIAAAPELYSASLLVLDADTPKEIELARKQLRIAISKATQP